MAAVGVLVYDGDCAFCTRWALWAQRHSVGLDVVPWQVADLAALGLSADECAAAVQYVDDGGRSPGAAAVASALRACRAPYRFVGTVITWPVMQSLADRAYAVVAGNRHRLPGGTAACVTPR